MKTSLVYQEYMPLPPASSDENTPDMNGDQPKLQFSHVECLMYAFHQMARRCPQILTDDTQADRLKDFRLRYIWSSNVTFVSPTVF